MKLLKKHKAFSLLELIIVVMIISLIGFFVFSTAIKREKKDDSIGLLTLQKFLQTTFKGQGDVEFFCINKSTQCYFSQNKKITTFEGKVKLGKDIETYILDKDNRLVQIEEMGRFNDNRISFRFHLYPNGSTSQMIVSTEDEDESIYYLPSYFGKAVKLKGLEEAKSLWIKDSFNLRDSGSYY